MNTENAFESLLSIFQTTLAEVRFGDIDATSLTRAAADVEAAAGVVATAQAALDDARRQLASCDEALTVHATRALAYARVYAETDPALRQQVDAITLPRAPRRGKNPVMAPARTLPTEPLAATKPGRRTAKKSETTPLSPSSTDDVGFEESA